MVTVATFGAHSSLASQAAQEYGSTSDVDLYPSLHALVAAFVRKKVDYAVLPVYNTREGDNQQSFNIFEQLRSGHWVDNVILYSDLSLGTFTSDQTLDSLELLVGSREVLNQCGDFIDHNLPSVNQMVASDVEYTLHRLQREEEQKQAAFIDAREVLLSHGLHILEREVAPHNRTRFAVFGHEMAPSTGYDATTLVTSPLDDRVGLLVDILNEFSRRGINILDMRSKNDIKTQKLQIYLEVEGHIRNPVLADAVAFIESHVIQQGGAFRVLGSFPRIDMRTKHITSIGFIGTGSMSKWFAKRFEGEGYEVLLSGRSSVLRPETMIEQVDVVVICVPISETTKTIHKYAPLIKGNKALLLLAGESEGTIDAALQATDGSVEVMLIHNLWGPQTLTMKNKNAVVVRTARSGLLCSELEAFLYKHGADIFHDSPSKHDLLMGVGQKLPTALSVALAMTLKENNITSEHIASHCTLTSLYPILAMARVHFQNPRTYAEIMSTKGAGRKIVDDFHENLATIMKLANKGDIEDICQVIEDNAQHLNPEFLSEKMKQAKAVDEVLGKMM